MPIVTLKVAWVCSNRERARNLNNSHSGCMYWFERVIKHSKSREQGDEPKGVNIINFGLAFDDIVFGSTPRQWDRSANAIFYLTSVNEEQFLHRAPAENIEALLPTISAACLSSPWQQVQGIGAALSQPLTDDDRRYLRHVIDSWAANPGYNPPKLK